MRTWVILLKFIPLVLALLLVTYIVVFIEYHYWFSSRITEQFCVEQRFMSNIYDLTNCSNQVLVSDVDGWIIESEVIVGALDRDKYFLIDKQNFEVKVYNSIMGLNARLYELKVAPYDMSNEINSSYLKNLN